MTIRRAYLSGGKTGETVEPNSEGLSQPDDHGAGRAQHALSEALGRDNLLCYEMNGEHIAAGARFSFTADRAGMVWCCEC